MAYLPWDISPHEAYDIGYKQGVVEAGRKIKEEMPLSGLTDPVDVVNGVPRYLRETLLVKVKKVTKWVAIFEGEEVFLMPDLKLWDAKKSADEKYAKVANYRGAYPIEIEVPL